MLFDAHGKGQTNNYFAEMCSGSEAGSYLRLIDFVYHSTQGLRVIKKKKKKGATRRHDGSLYDHSGRGTTTADDAQGTPTQSHISPSILIYED